MPDQGAIDAFWAEYCAAKGDAGSYVDAYAFGDSPELAEELLALVLSGEKTATCDLVQSFEAESIKLPEAGDHCIILDSSGAPRAVVRTTRTRQMQFQDVGEEVAQDEGEGDKSLAYWRREHEAYFRRWLAPRGLEFSEDLMVQVEWFELVYSANPR